MTELEINFYGGQPSSMERRSPDFRTEKKNIRGMGEVFILKEWWRPQELKKNVGFHVPWYSLDPHDCHYFANSEAKTYICSHQMEWYEIYKSEDETWRQKRKEHYRWIEYLKSKPLSQLTVAEAEELGMVKCSV